MKYIQESFLCICLSLCPPTTLEVMRDFRPHLTMHIGYTMLQEALGKCVTGSKTNVLRQRQGELSPQLLLVALPSAKGPWLAGDAHLHHLQTLDVMWCFLCIDRGESISRPLVAFIASYMYTEERFTAVGNAWAQRRRNNTAHKGSRGDCRTLLWCDVCVGRVTAGWGVGLVQMWSCGCRAQT